MDEFINNPWVVGIGAGVLSSLVVAFITRSIFSRRDNREYLRRIDQANQEILYAVRPGISEGVIPANDVLQRLATATARRYGLDRSTLYDLNEFASELTKEVMDSSFISASTKEDFCEKLSVIKEESPGLEQKVVAEDYQKAARYRRQMVVTMSMMVGMMTAVVGFVTSMESRTTSEPKQLLFLVIPAVVAVLAALLGVLMKENRLKVRSMEFNFAGLRAHFDSHQENERANPNKGNSADVRSSRDGPKH
ncbi:hypothetical protein [Halomonas binhaiensis]|uniref:Uncharacterized protein n=1 Tax=Halomonas binhaiensis TaxID=2562282 RepID=A0A5C1NFD8_9GAMM|nr:hypothetical protein [Halomonas binhaiensis]QEM80917.1 hypothetical protein E4T21_04645 [Halomonas binhaiensis]